MCLDIKKGNKTPKVAKENVVCNQLKIRELVWQEKQ